jgi:2-methylisocitrate lyase-like PEP mutase family enzyme
MAMVSVIRIIDVYNPRMAASSSTARAFRQLHSGPLLILANAWDAGSARFIERLGARAIATSSAAVAWTHGYPDGDVLPLPLLLSTLKGIARVITVPLSVDVEGGYADDAAAAAEVVSQVIDVGAVGINIEDGESPPARLCEKIERVKAAAARAGVDLFVNARVDVYLRALVPPERRLEETLARAERYRASGADGIFVPGASDAATIRPLASAIALPLNILARPNVPGAAELEAMGVRRLSAGSWLAQALYGRAAALATEFLREGSRDWVADGAWGYAEINTLMGGR